MSVTTNDGEFKYEPTAPYVLSEPDDEWCCAVVRTEDGQVLGSDGWQQMGCPEDATFGRDLAWIVPELNRLAGEIQRLQSLFAAAGEIAAEPINRFETPELRLEMIQRLAMSASGR
jgi:hypothetical protein